jgi:hypothetical protein
VNLHKTAKWLMLLCIGLISACSYMQNQQQLFAQRKISAAHCDQRYQYCQKTCDDNLNLCRTKSDARAARHFARYQQQQNVKGQIVMEEVQAFREPLACRKMTCDCDQDKMMCQQAYRGSIYKRLQSAMQLN